MIGRYILMPEVFEELGRKETGAGGETAGQRMRRPADPGDQRGTGHRQGQAVHPRSRADGGRLPRGQPLGGEGRHDAATDNGDQGD